MLHVILNNQHLFGDLDVAVVFIVTAAAVYLNDRLPVILRNHPMVHQAVKSAASSDFYWPAALAALGLLMLLFVEVQMAISSLFVLGYGLWLFHRTNMLVRS